jgi:hypothetical protein
MGGWIAAGLAVLSVATLAFTGAFLDREHGELHLFVKHRPSTRALFCSPLGESQRRPTAEERAAEEAYVDFVERHEGYLRSLALPFAPTLPVTRPSRRSPKVPIAGAF